MQEKKKLFQVYFKIFDILNKIHLKVCTHTIPQYIPLDVYILMKYLLKTIIKKYVLSMHSSNKDF